jgi:hypothetical protein
MVHHPAEGRIVFKEYRTSFCQIVQGADDVLCNVNFSFAVAAVLYLTASGLSVTVAAQPADAAVAAVDTVASTGASLTSAVTDTMHETASAAAGLSMTPDSVKKIDTAAVAPTHGNVAAAAAVLTDSTVNTPASDSGHQAQPVGGTSPAAAVTAVPPPVRTSSNYYGGMSPSGQGAGRGVAGQSSYGRTARKLLVTTDSAAAPHADSSTSVIDTLKRTAIQSADTASRTAAPLAAPPSSPYKMGKTAKIITAVGTCAVVGGIVTFILVKKHEDANNDDQGIPDPPDPPGY